MLLVVLGRRKLDIQKRDLLAVTCLTWAPHLYAIKSCATLKVRSKLRLRGLPAKFGGNSCYDRRSRSLNTRGWLLQGVSLSEFCRAVP